MKELGKIHQGFFEESIRQHCGYTRTEVSTGPGFGVDVSVIDIPGGLALAMASDPLSLIPSLGLQESAWLSVYLMANDIATTGHLPMYGQFVLNLPADFSMGDFKIYWSYIDTFCKDLKIAITGGHTGFIEGQNSTIAGGGTLTTIAPKDQILVSTHAKASNIILVTKQCAISSSAILTMSFPNTVKNKLGKETFDAGCDLFYKTSSVDDALSAIGGETKEMEVTAMHDVTEGGVLGAIYEMAIASGNGARIYNDRLPIGNAQQQICDLFSIDPRYSIGAGSMIIAVEKRSEDKVIQRLKKQNIDCVTVGELTESEKGIKLVDKNGEKDISYGEKDPYWAAFFNAYRNGWK